MNLISPDGRPYRASNPVEIKRLIAGFGYTEAPDTFHPDDATVAEVKKYLKDNPKDAERVIAEERAGQNRTSIVGDSSED